MSTIRLTAAEAVVRYLASQRVETPQGPAPLFGGVFAIFGHGNVAGLGEALYRHRETLPTLRAHNEQGMAHAAIAFGKAHMRRRMMAATTSIGPGATNLVTAAAAAPEALRRAKRPLILAGGGALYALASDTLRRFAEAHGIPVCETQGGKGALSWDHPLQLGAVGVTGSPSANELARDADLVLAVGSRLSDFTTGSHSLFGQAKLVGLNVNAFDATKWHALPLQADARLGLEALAGRLSGWKADEAWTVRARKAAAAWRDAVAALTSRRDVALPYDADVIGAVQRSSPRSTANDIVVNAGGTLPAELHKLWRTSVPGGYHMEYGYSCMGYEIAGGLGVKLAHPDREVIVMVGDGSYLMLNSEIATSVLLGKKIIVVVQDNHGYGCINRLQQEVGGEPFNNLFKDCVQGPSGPPAIDFAKHAQSMGAIGENVKTIGELEAVLARARAADRTSVICIETDPRRTTEDGGCWWEVAVPEASPSDKVRRARDEYESAKKGQRA